MATKLFEKDVTEQPETAQSLPAVEASLPLTRSENERSKWDDKGILIDPELIKYEEEQRKLILGK